MKKMTYIGRLSALLLAVLMLAFASVGCKKEETERPYKHLVTFNYNTGNKIDANCRDQYLGVETDGLVPIQPASGINNFELQAVIGYANEGWYLPKLDGEGNPIVDEDGRVVLDRKWDFATDRVNSDITLYANFLRNPTLYIVDEGDPSVVYISFTEMAGSTRKEPSKRNTPEKAGHTFYGYYYADGTEVTWPYTFGTEDATVYARFIEGTYEVVRTASEFTRALAQNKNIYLDADITFTSTYAWTVAGAYSGRIEGNGHTLRGIKTEFVYSRNSASSMGLFGTLKEGAVIRNLIMEDVDITYAMGIEGFGIKVSGFAAAIESGVTLENITLSGTITATPGEALSNSDVTYYAFLPLGNAELEAYDSCDWSGMTLPTA